MAARELTSSIYRVVPIAPVESDGASLVSRCPAKLRTRLGASGALVPAGPDARRFTCDAAELAAAFRALYALGLATRTGNEPTGRARTLAGAGTLARTVSIGGP